MPLLITNLSVSFRTPQKERVIEAVRNISFSIEKGEVLGLVGESGSGKSVTALSILGLLPYPAAFHPNGSIIFDGQELLNAPEQTLRTVRGKRISMIFQEPMTSLNPLHTIGKQIAEIIEIHGTAYQGHIKKRMVELLESVGLGHFKDRLDAYPHQLSGGERQRVMIAMAIANNPDLLIADEPTTAVDVTVQTQILSLLKRLQKERGMAMLFITHDLTIVRKMANRIAVMHEGEMVERGETKQIFSAPRHLYTRQLIASEPKGEPIALAKDAPTLLEANEVTVHFPRKSGWFGKDSNTANAVDKVNLVIKRGVTLGVVGESGSGKTTLGMALLRLIKSSGLITFEGQRIDGLKTDSMRPLRHHMQVVFQDPFGSLNPRLTVGDIIAEGLLVHKPDMTQAEREQAVQGILSEVGLSADMIERYPHEFSGGQRQRIAIARAMILKPKLVVLDEPTSALDLSVQAQILALLKDLQEKYGLSFIFISHDLRVVRSIAHRILVMKAGQVVEEGDTEMIFTSPQQDYTRTLIAASLLKAA